MRKGIEYCRVSTDNQVGEDKYGLDVQTQDVKRYCEDNDILIVESFIEEGVSGADMNRPELTRLLSYDLSDIDVVVIPKTDRLARDVELYYWIKLELKKRGVEVISVQDDYSVYGLMGNIMESIVVSFAEFEKNMITSRTSKGRKMKAATGTYSGGKPPYGYNAVERRLVVNEDEANVIRGIFFYREQGMILKDIAEELNTNGVTTRKGSKWYPAQVGYIINNRPLYEGQYRYGKESNWIKGTHEPIL